MKLWNKTVKLVTGAEPKAKIPRRKKITRRDLIRMESQIGAQLFGPIPAGHRREFFCLDDNTWIWYESWTEKGKLCEITTRYEVHPNGVLKVQDGQPYAVVEGEELQNLATAARLYHDRVAQEVYNRDPISGQRIAA